VYRFHDAGEPTGTAGKPIFQHIEGKQLINVLVAVIRYFGGIKLGAGGLTRAYGQTARLAIEAAELYTYIELMTVTLILDYKQIQALEYWLKKHGGEIVQQTFAEQVRVAVKLPVEQAHDLSQAFSHSY
jgi:putative IMPACT (imprinted ancient) family translation regulator